MQTSQLLPRLGQRLWHTPNQFVYTARWSANQIIVESESGFSIKLQASRPEKDYRLGGEVPQYQPSVGVKSAGAHPSSKSSSHFIRASVNQ